MGHMFGLDGIRVDMQRNSLKTKFYTGHMSALKGRAVTPSVMS
jgi:hypothetical protein